MDIKSGNKVEYWIIYWICAASPQYIYFAQFHEQIIFIAQLNLQYLCKVFAQSQLVYVCSQQFRVYSQMVNCCMSVKFLNSLSLCMYGYIFKIYV